MHTAATRLPLKDIPERIGNGQQASLQARIDLQKFADHDQWRARRHRPTGGRDRGLVRWSTQMGAAELSPPCGAHGYRYLPAKSLRSSDGRQAHYCH